MKDSPRPSCDAIQVPKLDDQLKDHLKAKATLWLGEVLIPTPGIPHRPSDLPLGRPHPERGEGILRDSPLNRLTGPGPGSLGKCLTCDFTRA